MSSFVSKLSLIFGFVFSAIFAFALSPNAVTVTLTSSPNFNDDSNAACAGAGARAAYVTFKITNTSGATLNNLSANLNTLTVATGNIFRLAGGQAATQYIGTLGTTAATNTKYVYWYVEYPCNKNNIACNMTCTVSDNAAGTVSNTATVTTKSAISANAGGLISSTTLDPCAVLGQIVSYTVTYSFGGVATGETFDMQPAGNTGVGGFDAGAFQLINARINASDVPGIAVGATDKLYFTATANNSGTGKLVTVTYYFECKKVGISTSAKPYAVQTSGNQIKYTGNYGATPINVPAATFPLTISKRATPSNPNRGDLVTYTITLRNTSVFPTSVSAIKDVLPTGLAFQGYSTTSQITATNSVAAPILGATGSMTWKGGGAATVFPYTHYYIPANDSIVLKYTALVGATVPTNSVLTNTAKAYIGSDSTAVVSAAVCAQCVDTDGDGVPDMVDNSVSVSGTVVQDGNALTDGIVSGAGTNADGALYANLLNSNGILVQSVLIASNGSYTFTNVVPDSNYSVIIATTNTATTPNLPDAYTNIGEGATNAGDGIANGRFTINIPNYNTTGLIFGIEQAPLADTNSEASRVNPGEGVNVPVLATTFSGTDADGIITNIRISAFPTNAVNITINGMVYTADNFPSTGVIVPTNAAGNPTQTIEIQPTDGAVTVSIPFFTIDNAGVESRKGGTAELPFHTKINTLPVKMIAFKADVQNCKVVLKWVTATELNTQRFEIWRSTNGDVFEKTGEVNAAGTTNISQTYSFEDPKTAQYNYYQVRSVDFDGYTEIFNLGSRVKVKTCFDDTNEGITAIYPNPNRTSQLTLRFSVAEVNDDNAQVVISDLTGKVLSTQNISINQGANVSTINIDDLAIGMYIVQIQTSNWVSKGERLVRITN